MEKRILFCLSLFFIIGYPTYAQMVSVMDNLLKNSIDDNMKTNLVQSAMLEVIEKQNSNIQEMVEATEKIQYDYWEFLKQTTSTATLALSDMENDQQLSGEVSAASQHLNDYSFAENIFKVYQQQAEPLAKSQLLYEQLTPFDETYIFTQLAPFADYQKARKLNVVALEEMSQRRKLQLAKAYQQIAQYKIEKANELRTLLLTDQQFLMTEAERLQTIKRMQDFLQRSQQLKVKADQMVSQSAKPAFYKEQMLNSFKLGQERKVMAGTTLFQD